MMLCAESFKPVFDGDKIWQKPLWHAPVGRVVYNSDGHWFLVGRRRREEEGRGRGGWRGYWRGERVVKGGGTGGGRGEQSMLYAC